MRKLTGSDTALEWVQPQSNKRFFELQSGGDAIATLSWEKALGTLATAQTAGNTWTFKRVGFFNTRVTVRSPGSDTDIATFKPSWGYGGMLEVQGRTYTWNKLDFWGNRWGFAWHDGTLLLSFGYAGGPGSIFKLQGVVEMSPGSVSTNTDMPLLATLGWYIMVLMHDDNTAVAGAVVATM
jgi:hypothetical protein